MSFKDKVVIVTGASSGIGAATAVELCRQGAAVVLAARNPGKLAAVRARCAAAGPPPLLLPTDLVNEADLRNLVDKTVEKYGRIDILINNAGFGAKVPFESADAMKVFDEIVGLNLRAVVQLTHLTLPHLIKSKGNIVNISSVAALKNIQDSFAYCTAKAGLDHFSRCIASELAPKGVRVNVVNPGPVRTDFVENMGVNEVGKFYENIGEMMPLKRVSEPEEITDVILFLASEKARGVTGASWVTDDGYMIK
ncbi:3-oxoacyl-[acyl-carrier-protein] reductase FabG-like [Plutella xylostella]|uniref:3-oxoacyl-[acyl-carrier-protein] reductase FabG-like n=1 Tax=Plutella xylostella TaxID=51655 RepID=UPI0020324EE4|nr:3-oxoacyl-[acyl-carrier-protein] reductase FabG-like [Plutella xylostella]